MPIYQLSQLAQRANPEVPTFNVPQFNFGVADLMKRQEDAQKTANVRAYSEMVGKSKLQEGAEKNKDIQSKLQTALKTKEDLMAKSKANEEKRAQIDLLKDEMSQIRHTLSTQDLDFSERVNLQSRYNELAKQVSDFESTYNPVKESKAIDDAEKEIQSQTSSYESEMRPYKLEAARALAAPDMPANASKERDYSKMESIGKLLNDQYQILYDEYNAQHFNSDIVKSAEDRVAELQQEYLAASKGLEFKSDIKTKYQSLANAAKNASEALKGKYESAGLADKANKDLTDDVTTQIEKWTSTNQKVVDGLNLAYGFVQAFDKLKNAQKSPAQFAALVKAVNKLIEPTAAVMADDMKTMANYGGGEQTAVQASLTNLAAAKEAFKGLAQSFSQTASELKNKVGDKITELTGGEKTEPETKPSSQSGFNLNKAVEESKQAIITQYTKQVPQIVKVGEEFANIVKNQIKAVQDSMKSVVTNSIDYAQFRNANTIKLANGETATAASLFSTDTGKKTLQSIVDSRLNSLFASINNTDNTLVSKALEEANAESNTSSGTTTPTTDNSGSNAKQTGNDALFLSPIGTPGTTFGEIKHFGKSDYKWTEEKESSSGGRWKKIPLTKNSAEQKLEQEKKIRKDNKVGGGGSKTTPKPVRKSGETLGAYTARLAEWKKTQK